MKTRRTLEFIESNNVEVLIADKTDPVPEIDELLVSLGNTGKAIPFYAIFPADGSEPITFSGLLRQKSLIGYLKQAVNASPNDEQLSKPSTDASGKSLQAGLPSAAQH